MENELIKQEIREFIRELRELLNSVPLENWYEGAKDFVDYACFLNPTAWEVGYEDFRKLVGIFETCIELKKRLKED